MSLTSQAHINVSLYIKGSQKLLIKIEEGTIDAINSINKLDLQTNDDKICISTVGNNFARDLEYTLNKLQRITLDNHKQGENNKNLKEAVQAFSTFAYSIQLAFGNDFNKLKMEIINALQNLGSKLNPLLDIVRENSSHSSKWDIYNILDYLYNAIVKVALRTKLEHFDQNEIQAAITDVFQINLDVLDKLANKKDLSATLIRTCHEAVEATFQNLEEINLDVDHYDDKIRDLVLNVTTKIADALYNFSKAIRSKDNMSELTLCAKLVVIDVIPPLKDILDLFYSKNLQDSNGKNKNFLLNAVVQSLGASILCSRHYQRLLDD